MHVMHLTSSTFFGGPERQMLGLARASANDCRTSFVSFSEHGKCQEFLKHVQWNGFEAAALRHDTPNLPGATVELARLLRARQVRVLLCHGYKANLLGRLAARAMGIPVVAVSRGWTGESAKVRVYETIDRFHLRHFDRVVCVSAGQAQKVRRAGVPPGKIRVIRNSARLTEVATASAEGRAQLQGFFFRPGKTVVVAAGRLSPEKGFDYLIEAARRVINAADGVRVAIFGEGALRPTLQRLINEADLEGLVVLPGFRSDLDQLLPNADLLVLPSHTEGLPNVVLEAGAAAVPVVATAVGGTPEVVVDGQTGFLVPSADAATLAARIGTLVADDSLRHAMGQAAAEHVRRQFTFEAQAAAYRSLFHEIVGARRAVAA